MDYLGLADQLKNALVTYTESDSQWNPPFDTAQAIVIMMDKHDIACDMMNGFNGERCSCCARSGCDPQLLLPGSYAGGAPLFAPDGWKLGLLVSFSVT